MEGIFVIGMSNNEKTKKITIAPFISRNNSDRKIFKNLGMFLPVENFHERLININHPISSLAN